MRYVFGDEEPAMPDCRGGDMMRVPTVSGSWAYGCVTDPTTGAALKFTGAGAAVVPVTPPPALPNIGYVISLANLGYSLDRNEVLALNAAVAAGLVKKDASGKWSYVTAAPPLAPAPAVVSVPTGPGPGPLVTTFAPVPVTSPVLAPVAAPALAPTLAPASVPAASAPTTKSSLITLVVIGVGALGLWWLLK